MKNKRKRKGRTITILIQTLRELFSSLKYGFVEELGKVAVIIQILIPVMIAETNLSIHKMILISCVLIAIAKYIKEIGYKLNHITDRGFPIPYKRFTKKDENGFVSIEEESVQEAILYLCDIEDYLKSKGWL